MSLVSFTKKMAWKVKLGCNCWFNDNYTFRKLQISKEKRLTIKRVRYNTPTVANYEDRLRLRCI